MKIEFEIQGQNQSIEHEYRAIYCLASILELFGA